MRKFIPMLFVLFTAACVKFPPEGPKDIKTTITDLKGIPVKESGSNVPLKLSAPEFIELNKQGLLEKDGMISFDNIMVQIKEAKDDYIITAVPIMDYIDVRSLNISLYIRQTLVARLCIACILYQPTVRGEIFAGFTGGVTDGTFLKPAEMIHDAAGNIYVIDQRISNHDLILKISPAGVTTSFSGTGDVFGRLVGIGIDESRGVLYVSDATSQQVKSVNLVTPSTIVVLAGSGVAGNTDGTGAAASFRFGTQAVDNFGSSETGQGLTVDASGNIYVGENQTGSLASQVRRITPAGVVTTVPGTHIVATMSETESAMPSGITLNSANEIFTTSGSSGFFQGINKFTTAGVFSRFAGKVSFEGLNDGTGAVAQFSYPKAIRTYNDYFYVADGTNGALRRVSPVGKVITLAGVGHFNTNRFNGSGPLAPLQGSYLMEGLLAIPNPDYYETAASAIRMDQAGGVTAVSGGLIYVSDYGYQCVWKITVR